MTEEFYAAVKKDISTYQEKLDYFIKSGCQSPAVIDRWTLKVRGLKEKKRHYEQVLRRELDGLEPEQFSAPHLGKAYGLLRRRWREGKGVTLAALEGQLAPEELDGLTAAAQQPQARNTAREALEDCKQTILAESRRGNIHSAEDLNGLQQALKQKKAYGG